MTPQSDIDRLMELVSEIHDVADSAASGEQMAQALDAIVAATEQEMFRWREQAEAHQPIRDAAYRDTGIRTVCPKDADLDPMRDEF